jgi:ribonuclease P protein subunit POP4
VNPKVLVKHEFIGLEVAVVAASDPTQIGVRGRVVDETRNTITIDVNGVEKVVQKRGAVFRFEVDGEVDIDGERILFRPEDRIKRAW